MNNLLILRAEITVPWTNYRERVCRVIRRYRRLNINRQWNGAVVNIRAWDPFMDNLGWQNSDDRRWPVRACLRNTRPLERPRVQDSRCRIGIGADVGGPI